MIQNLWVLNKTKVKIKSREVHLLAKNLRNDLNFNVNSLSIVFLTSEEIHKVNIDYLNHNYSTDIITFNYSGNTKELDGEIIISVEDADKNASIYQVSLNEEIIRLIIHGFLHLLGYDDTTNMLKKEMKKLEDMYCIKYNNLVLIK